MGALISDEYLKQQEQMHENPNYGVASVSYAPLVSDIINKTKVETILDYGCGKGRLAGAIDVKHKAELRLYDPAIFEYSLPPKPAELVCCIDVLEHIEPDLLDNVLDDIKSLSTRYAFLTIHTGPAVKTLPDGRNAHLIQEDAMWWLPKIWDRFFINSFSHTPGGFYVVCRHHE